MRSQRAKKKDRSTRAVGTPQRRPLLTPGREFVAALLLLVIAISVLYPEIVFENKVMHSPDAEAATSVAAPIREAMQQGERYPLWNPFLFAGMPSYESLAYTPYVYPVSVITDLLVRVLHFPGQTWLLFHVLLLGLGVYLLLREWGVPFLIAAGAGILMMWMPNYVAIGAHGHGSQANAIAYMPFVLLVWDRVWRGKDVVFNFSALVILLGLQLLRAHLQICYYTFALLGLHLIFFASFKVRDAFRGGPDLSKSPVYRVVQKMISNGDSEEPGSRARRGALLDVGVAVALLTLAVVGALLISAVLYLPVRDYAPFSIRGASEGGLEYDYATSWSLHPSEMLTFVLAFSSGFGKAFYHGHMPFTDYPNYLGIFLVGFALAAGFLVRTRLVAFLVVVVVVTTLVSFGKYFSILYDPLFRWMPYFDKFRVPVMILIVQQLAFVLLFALGLSRTLEFERNRGKRLTLWGIAGAIALVVIVLLSKEHWTTGYAQSIAPEFQNVRSPQQQVQIAQFVGGLYYRDLVKFSLLLLAGVLLLSLYFRGWVVGRVVIAVTLAMAIGDIYSVNRHILHPEKLFRSDQLRVIHDRSEREKIFAPDDVVDFLRSDEGYFRIFPIFHPQVQLFRDFRSNRYMNFGIASIGGYHAAKLSAYQEFVDVLDAAISSGDLQLLNILNVRYIVASNPFPENPAIEEVWRGTDHQGTGKVIYRNKDDLGRIYFVDTYRVAPDGEALEALASGGIDLSSIVLLDHAPEIEPVSSEGARAMIREYGLGEIKIGVELPAPTIMVLSEVYYPRWKLEVDGRPWKIHRANYILRAVSLPEGSHELVFAYDSSLLKSSLIISVVTFSLAILLLIASGLTQIRSRWKCKHSS